MQADENPRYEGAPDYEYDEVANHDNAEIQNNNGRRKVRAEVVDRCSIYREKEEGWEDVATDNNPYYDT